MQCVYVRITEAVLRETLVSALPLHLLLRCHIHPSEAKPATNHSATTLTGVASSARLASAR